MSQNTNHILMIKPNNFGYNNQTAINNFYQQKPNEAQLKSIAQKALKEFNDFVFLLKQKGVNVIVFEDLLATKTPDSVFPNNWISFHSCGTIFLYPMFAQNRRNERRKDILYSLEKKHFFNIRALVDFTNYEESNVFLEGTGSMVLDRENKICYAATSQRTDKELVYKFCQKLLYEPVFFNAFQSVINKRELIYHTNVMMCIADKYVIICLDCIDDDGQKEMLLQKFKRTKKEVIEISENQINSFTANLLQVMGDTTYLAMSTSAYDSLNKNQIQKIEKYNPILHASLKTIEAYGGGSARCMMAEIFLPKKSS